MWRFTFVAAITCAMVLGDSLAVGQCEAGWTLAADSGPPSRSAHAMAFDIHRAVTVVFGGYSGGTYLGDTWESDGKTWQMVASAGPAPASEPAMAYDTANQVMVMFGGTAGSAFYGTTWQWDGNSWISMSETGPSPRWGHAMTYDQNTERILLFGGYDESDHYKKDLWGWDGTEWILLSNTGPGIRLGHGLCYDSQRGRAVLFGGYGVGGVLADTWEWDGESWIYFDVSGPGARESHAMAYDSEQQVTMLFGGTTYEADTWTWDGTRWNELAVSGPGPLIGHAMTFDSLRRKTVLFGGYQGTWLDDTWEHGVALPEILDQPDDLEVAPGTQALFEVAAAGEGELTYQWNKDGLALQDNDSISGSKDAVLTIDPVAQQDSGAYEVVITNLCGAIVSKAAVLTVRCAGDANADGLVDLLDVGFVQSRFGCVYPDDGENCRDADVNADEVVDPLDSGFVLARLGNCP